MDTLQKKRTRGRAPNKELVRKDNQIKSGRRFAYTIGRYRTRPPSFFSGRRVYCVYSPPAGFLSPVLFPVTHPIAAAGKYFNFPDIDLRDGRRDEPRKTDEREHL